MKKLLLFSGEILMKKIIFVLLFTVSAFAQVTLINESFSEPCWKITDSTKAMYIFNADYHTDYSTGKTIVQDLTTNGNDLTAVGWAGSVTDSLVYGCPIYPGLCLRFDDALSNELTSASTDLNPGIVGFTIQLWAIPNNIASSPRVVSKGVNATGGGSWHIRGTTPGNATNYLDDDNAILSNSTFINGVFRPVDGWTYAANTFAYGGNAHSYVFNNSVNGYDNYARPASLAAWDSDITPSQVMSIGRLATIAGTFVDMYCAGFKYDHEVFSQKRLKEELFLDPDWYSKAGGVTRVRGSAPANLLGQNQGIVSDSIYIPLADTSQTAGYQWQLVFDAWSSSGTPTLNCFTSGLSENQAVTTDSTRYTITLGAGDFSSDSLYFHTTETVYIDNVVLSEALIPVATDEAKGHNGYSGKWKGFNK